MSVQVLTPPASEPVSLAEAKAHARIDDAADDGLIANLISASRHIVEHATGRALITRRVLETWDFLASAPNGRVRLAQAPVTTVHAIRLTRAGAASVVMDPSRYGLDRQSGELWFLEGEPSPRQAQGGIEVEYDAGYGGTADVPIDLRQAVLIALAALYENRAHASQIGASIADIIAPYRRVRL